MCAQRSSNSTASRAGMLLVAAATAPRRPKVEPCRPFWVLQSLDAVWLLFHWLFIVVSKTRTRKYFLNSTFLPRLSRDESVVIVRWYRYCCWIGAHQLHVTSCLLHFRNTTYSTEFWIVAAWRTLTIYLWLGTPHTSQSRSSVWARIFYYSTGLLLLLLVEIFVLIRLVPLLVVANVINYYCYQCCCNYSKLPFLSPMKYY